MGSVFFRGKVFYFHRKSILLKLCMEAEKVIFNVFGFAYH